MTIQPTKSLEHSIYFGAVAICLVLSLSGFRDAIVGLIFFVLIVSQLFTKWRGPQTAEQESLDATGLTALNLARKLDPNRSKVVTRSID